MKKKKFLIVNILLLASALVFASGGKDSTEQKSTPPPAITVYIAASTTDLIGEIGALYTEKTGIAINLNPASSGTLARQIEQGAPADVYISASEKWMDYVYDLGVTQNRFPFVTNRLVLIVPEDSKLEATRLDSSTDFAGLFNGKISIGDPAHVPAGKYAQEALQSYGWYTSMENRILPGSDVRAAMAVVELGETETGIVYETDAKKSDKVRIIARFPDDAHTPIAYFIADLKGAGPGAHEFTMFVLQAPEALDCCRKYGFSLPE